MLIKFFFNFNQAFTKLDQLEIQLATTEHPPHSPQLARFHAQASATLSEVTSSPLAEGYALLDVTGRGAPGAEVGEHFSNYAYVHPRFIGLDLTVQTFFLQSTKRVI